MASGKATAVRDQYEDGVAAKVWEHYIGGSSQRADHYRAWLCQQLLHHGCHNVLDAACGTGYVIRCLHTYIHISIHTWVVGDIINQKDELFTKKELKEKELLFQHQTKIKWFH